MASLIHYQPLTGPVWRPPVAEALAWLPRGEPARPLERRPPGEFVYPPFYELYNPAGLHWLPSGRWPLPLEVRKLGDFQQPPFDALYKPERLGWRPAEPPPRTILEVRKPSEFAQPIFEALYKPEQLGWMPSSAYLGRALPRGTLDLTVAPFQFAAPAFDPQNLEWMPKGPPPRTLLEVRKLGDFVQPPFDALYKSEGLQWTPKGTYPQLPVERRILGDFAQPAFDALYKPEGLQWLFEGQLSVRGIPYPLQSSWVVDPKPVVSVTFDPQLFPFQSTDLSRGMVLPRTLQGEFSTPPLPPGPDVIPPAPSVTQDVIRNFSLRDWRKWHRPEDERRLRELRLTPAVAEVIAKVAERQVRDLVLDEQQRLEELTRELELKRLKWQGRYLELLNVERQQLIDAEIASLIQQKQAALRKNEEEKILLLLLMIS